MHYSDRLTDNGEKTEHSKSLGARAPEPRREASGRLVEPEDYAEIFELLVSAVRDYAIFMLDPEGNVATWNLGAQRIKGYAPKEIIGRHFSTFYTEEDIEDGKPARELAIAREQGSVEDEGW